MYVDKEALEKATVHFLHMSNNQKNIHKYNYCFVMIFNEKNTLEEINLQNPERISKDNSQITDILTLLTLRKNSSFQCIRIIVNNNNNY